MTNSIQKGKRVERELAAWLRSLGFDARRSQQYCGSAEGDADIFSEALKDYHIESKATGSCALNASTIKRWWAQVQRDNQHGKIPVIFNKCNRGSFIFISEARYIENHLSFSVALPPYGQSFTPNDILDSMYHEDAVHAEWFSYAGHTRDHLLLYKNDTPLLCIGRGELFTHLKKT